MLLEVGFAAGRSGVRTGDQALAVAQHAAQTPGVDLVGVSAYEGALADVDAARKYLAEVRAVAEMLVDAGLLRDHVLLSAGGSAYFDVVADVLGGPDVSGVPSTTILRSGAYLTHDHGTYAGSTPFTRISGHLYPALRIWAQVISTPEDGLAIVGAGKRDVPYDSGLPVVLRRHRAGQAPVAVVGWDVTRTNDQHAYLEGTDPLGTALAVGDLLELGISHPCTAFDKWRAIPVIDAGQRVVDVVTTGSDGLADALRRDAREGRLEVRRRQLGRQRPPGDRVGGEHRGVRHRQQRDVLVRRPLGGEQVERRLADGGAQRQEPVPGLQDHARALERPVDGGGSVRLAPRLAREALEPDDERRVGGDRLERAVQVRPDEPVRACAGGSRPRRRAPAGAASGCRRTR